MGWKVPIPPTLFSVSLIPHWSLRPEDTDPFTTLALLLIYSGLSPGNKSEEERKVGMLQNCT